MLVNPELWILRFFVFPRESTKGSSIGTMLAVSVPPLVDRAGSIDFSSSFFSSERISRPGQLHMRTSQTYRPTISPLKKRKNCIVTIVEENFD